MCQRKTDARSANAILPRAAGEDGNTVLARRRAALARPVSAGLVAALLAVMLGGCSDFYFDRRDTIALGAGDAIAANETEQIIDPWPAHSRNTNIATNGQRMQAAVERYRNDKVIPPVDPMTPAVAATASSSTQSQTTTAGSAPAAAPTTLVIQASPAATASE
jgi:hypothetical protein